MMVKEYKLLTNEELVELSQKGDTQAREVLSGRFLDRKCYVPRFDSILDSDDFIQEGMKGFMKAVDTFDKTRGIPFEAYASTCMANSIVTATRKIKEIPVVDDPDAMLVAVSDKSPYDLLVEREKLSRVMTFCEKELTDMEKSVIFLRVGDKSYKEIAEQLGTTEKSVENALRRAREKLNSFIGDK